MFGFTDDQNDESQENPQGRVKKIRQQIDQALNTLQHRGLEVLKDPNHSELIQKISRNVLQRADEVKKAVSSAKLRFGLSKKAPVKAKKSRAKTATVVKTAAKKRTPTRKTKKA